MGTFDHSRSKSSSSAKSSELTTNRFAPRKVPTPQAAPTPEPAEHTPIQPKLERDENGNPAWWSRLTFEPPPRYGVQPKLTVGQPHDQYEQEADRVAEQVMTMPDVQRQTASHPEEDEETVQTKPLGESVTSIQREAIPEDEEVQTKPSEGLVQREAEPEEEVQTKPLNHLQREAAPEDEEIQTKPLAASITPLIQRDAISDEEEVQTKPLDRIQREENPEEEEVQTKATDSTLQREEIPEEEEPIQAKAISTLQREEMPEEEESLQAKPAPEANPNLQRQATLGEEEPIQAKAISTLQFTNKPIQKKAPVPSPTASLESQLAAQKGGGSPLSDDVQSFMESRFSTDFSHVRVHTDTSAVQMNKDLSAQAFTHGSDVYFGAGKSPGKNELTAHELTHVVQQTGGVRAKPISLSEKKGNKLQAKAETHQSAGLESLKPEEEPLPQSLATTSKPNQPEQQSGATATGNSRAGKPLTKTNLAAPVSQAGAPSAPGSVSSKSASVPTGGAPRNDADQTDKAAASRQQEKGLAGGAIGVGGGTGGTTLGGGGKTDAGGTTIAHGQTTPTSPHQDPAFQAVVGNVKNVGQQQKQHEPATTKSQEAQGAAVAPANEVESKAQANQVGQMEQAETPPFNAAEFKAALMKRIAEVTPKNLEEADDFKKNNKLEPVKGELGGKVKDEKQATQKPLEEKTKQAPNTSGIEPKPVTPMSPPQPGQVPAGVGAEQAVPKPKGQGEVEAPIQADSQKLDHKMAEANITEEQLAKSNEPEFQATLKSKQTAQTHSAQVPQEYRQFEQGQLAQGRVEATATAQEKTQGMHADRAQLLGQVGGQQVDTKGKDEQQRTKVAGDINKIYQDTKTKVEKTLSDLDNQVGQAFDKGAGEAKQIFEDYVEQKMNAYKDKRYNFSSDPIGAAWRWGGDKLFGMPPEVNAFYEEGRNLYLKKMDGVIDQVVGIVGKGLTQAKTEVANGKRQVQTYVAQLPDNLKAIGQQAASDIQGKFGELEQSIDSKKDQLIDTLAQKYQEKLAEVDASIKEKKEANRGLIDKAIDAVVGVIKTIVELGKLLLQVLAKVANVIPQILKDPIGFFNQLASGVKQGFQNFSNNIVNHLKKGLIGWLTGTLAGTGIQLPEKFDLQGIFTLVAQILGLGYDMIRARLVKRFGEKKVSHLEQTVGIFQTLVAKGIGGIWQFVQEKIGDLKAMFLDNIQGFIIESVIKAGILWVISLLNPASAFVRACKAIYDLVQFFMENAERIANFINTLLESITAIAAGNVAQVAKSIESALAQAIPLVIDLLAKLLGLGGISQKVHSIIKQLQKPIKAAIDWVIEKAVKVVKKIGKKLGFGKNRQSNNNKDKKEQKEEVVEVPFTMSGNSHTLTLKSGNNAKIIMASNPKLISKKINEAINKLKLNLGQPQVKERIEELEKIEKMAREVERVLHNPRASSSDKKNMKNEGIKLTSAISAYGAKYNVKDIEEVLKTYPAPVVGLYNQILRDKTPPPDGTTREAHHAPPLELAETLNEELVNASQALLTSGVNLTDDPFRKAADNIAGAGENLPAILVHVSTHRVKGAGSRIHGSEIRAELKKRLEQEGIMSKETITTSKGQIAVKAGNKAYKRFISEVEVPLGNRTKRIRMALQDKDLPHVKLLFRQAYNTAAAQTLHQVEIALEGSKFDGSENDRKVAMKDLRAKAKEVWKEKLLKPLD